MKLIQYLPTALSLCRLPLAALLFFDNATVRLLAVVGSVITDVADGFIARRYGAVTRFGTYIDPITDKLFVFTALAIYFLEKKLDVQELTAFLLRDISLMLFALLLLITGSWKEYEVKSFFLGKVMTALQFLVLILLSVNQRVSPFLYVSMAIIGALCFVNLLWVMKRGASAGS